MRNWLESYGMCETIKRAAANKLQLFVCSFFNIYINLILIYKLKFNNISSLRTSSAFNYFEFNFLTFV